MSEFGASIARDDNRSKCYPRFIVGAAFAAVLSTGVAFAADMPAKSPAAEPAYQWSGCYTGLNAGGGASASNFTTTVGAGTFLIGSDPATISNDGTGSGSGSNFLVDRDRDMEKVRKVMAKLAYPVATLKGITVDGFGPPAGVPITWIIDSDGKIRDMMIDVRDELLNGLVLPLLPH